MRRLLQDCIVPSVWLCVSVDPILKTALTRGLHLYTGNGKLWQRCTDMAFCFGEILQNCLMSSRTKYSTLASMWELFSSIQFFFLHTCWFCCALSATLMCLNTLDLWFLCQLKKHILVFTVTSKSWPPMAQFMPPAFMGQVIALLIQSYMDHSS